jgi:hypothetical protein
MDLQTAREYGLNRNHFGLDKISLLPHLKPKTLEEWDALAKKYPLEEAGHPAIALLIDRLYSKYPQEVNTGSKSLFSTANKQGLKVYDTLEKLTPTPGVLYGTRNVSPIAVPSNSKELVKSVGSNTIALSSDTHRSSIIVKPSGDMHVFDSRARPYTDPIASHSFMHGPLEKIAGRPDSLSYCNMPGAFQTRRGTCMLWSRLRLLHPEKTDEEFRQMVLATQKRTGLPEKFVDDKRGRGDENLDLIPIAIFEQLLAEGYPKVATIAERLEYRKGMGRTRRRKMRKQTRRRKHKRK